MPDEAPMTSAVNDGMASSQVSSRNSKKIDGYSVDYKNSKYSAALTEHNISDTCGKDPDIEYYRELVLGEDSNTSSSLNDLEREIHRRDDALWKTDMIQCARSNEARFQRTIMMTILNRQELDDRLEFICEAPWISERLPGAECPPAKCKIKQPKPDVAVAFRSESLLSSNQRIVDFGRLKHLHGDIFFEGFQEWKKERAFHFFSMEVKGKRGQNDNNQAQFQNLNTASQALVNIYRCMKEVNDLDTYFKDVRVFSAVATVHGLWIRIHRPVRFEKDSCFDPSYPFGFEFDELECLSQRYSRHRATNIVFNLLCNYGLRKLHPILKRTIEKLLRLHPHKTTRPSMQDLQRAAEIQAQVSSGRKRRAPDLRDSLTSNSKRRLDNISIDDSQGSEVSVGG